MLNPLTPTAAKSSLTILTKVSSKSMVGEIFEREMLIRTLLTTLLQIFCQTILNAEFIIKSILDPDDNIWRNSVTGKLCFIATLPSV